MGSMFWLSVRRPGRFVARFPTFLTQTRVAIATGLNGTSTNKNSGGLSVRGLGLELPLEGFRMAVSVLILNRWGVRLRV